ncbi:MAG: hypothetical protein AVDCRST_MAG11-2236, partial [uncultured Gemmatimonadaceae bacterium]
AHREAPVHDERARPHEHHHARREFGEAGGERHAGVGAHAALDGRERPAHPPRERALLGALAREGAHRAHPVQHLAVPRPEPGEEALVHPLAPRLPARRERADERGDRHQAEHRRGERPVQPAHPPRGDGDV